MALYKWREKVLIYLPHDEHAAIAELVVGTIMSVSEDNVYQMYIGKKSKVVFIHERYILRKEQSRRIDL